MDFFYDGQVRRYLTQFMRVFIGFKYKAGDGEERLIPVMYGDMTRQVAGIIKDNSENKMPTVPRVACYITGLELDTSRLSDPTFVSKVQIREREYETVDGRREYYSTQGAGYTVERLMPTPFKLKIKADIWTSNTDQKLQLLEQILVLFNPSLEVQTTDNYIDWTSLSVIYLNSVNFSSRTIPVGTESDIDIASLEFEMPIYITPPAKVKKLGVVRAVIANMFGDTGDAQRINDLVYNGSPMTDQRVQPRRYGIVMLKANNGNPHDYAITVVDVGQAVLDAGLDNPPETVGKKLDWELVLAKYGGYKPGISQIRFTQPGGGEIIATIAINPAEPTVLIASLFPDTVPGNTLLTQCVQQDTTTYTSIRSTSKGTIDAIVNPYNFNPVLAFGSQSNFPVGLRYLMLEDVNPHDVNEDGPDAWKNLVTDIHGSYDSWIKANSIIEWNGTQWKSVFDPEQHPRVTDFIPVYISNLRTGIQYKWDGIQWLKSFEGEYAAGYWRFDLDPQ
jgi:hypothetical protein